MRLGGRDVAGLVLVGDMYGAPYDLLAAALGVRLDRVRWIVARWRRAGYVATGRLGPGPPWCWLTCAGLAVTGQRYTPARPALGRLAHIRAVLAVRLSLEASDAYGDGRAWWRSERRIRAAIGGRVRAGHVPDAEVSWPDVAGSRYAGQCWAVEAELTPKPLARTAAIMAGLLARSSDYGPGAAPAPTPRYDRVVYLTAPAARGVTERAAAGLPGGVRERVTVRDLPPGGGAVSFLFAYLQFRVFLWLARLAWRVTVFTVTLAVVVAAAPNPGQHQTHDHEAAFRSSRDLAPGAARTALQAA